MKRRAGFSMIETLVVLCIIMILMTLLVPVLTKALRMAKTTAAGEEMRSDRVGEMATAVHEGNKSAAWTPQEIVQHARTLFRQEGQGGQKKILSTMLYQVGTDEEFRAYWHTLLNKQNMQLPEFTRKDYLVAFTPEGARYELPPVERDTPGPAHIIRWEFISTRLDETGRMDLGGNVIYSDGRREYVAYPREFPMTRQVAELSHRFYMEHIF